MTRRGHMTPWIRQWLQLTRTNLGWYEIDLVIRPYQCRVGLRIFRRETLLARRCPQNVWNRGLVVDRH